MRKYRIVIRAFTNRRDVAPMEVLKRLLERRGCEVMIASVRNFDRAVKHWKPDAVVVNTQGNVMIKEHYPDVQTIFFCGEGYHGPNDSHAQVWIDHPDFYKNMDLGLVWGPRVKDECDEMFDKSWDTSKLHVVGNPKMDLIKFMPEHLKTQDSNSVGFVCRFPKINDHLNRPVIQWLVGDFPVEETVTEAKAAYGMVKAAKHILENTDLNISFRPHPYEQLESYPEIMKRWFGKQYADRIHIDNSLFMPAWIASQKALLSPTSTSFLEAYELDVPVINIDALGDVEDFAQNYVSFTKEWQDAAIMPKTLEELIELLSDDSKLTVKQNKMIEKQLQEFGDRAEDDAACLNAAEAIMAHLQSIPQRCGFAIPFPLMDLWDEISFRRTMKDNPCHQNLSYRRGYHDIPAYMDEMVELIETRANLRETLKKAA